MTTQSDVNKFLAAFKGVVGNRGLVLILRQKNIDTLAELGFSRLNVQNEIQRLESVDYVDGPVPDRDVAGEVWVFGRVIDHEEIYIKLKLRDGTQAVCISFHHAEERLHYPFKSA